MNQLQQLSRRFAWLAVVTLVLAVMPNASLASDAATAELREFVAETPDARAETRAALNEFLDAESTQRVARDHGIDLDEARGAVQTLGDEDLDRVENALEDLEESLVGGDKIVIRASVLIVILLVLLLLTVD